MREIQWFASGGGIAKCGPYKTQVEAYDAMRLAPNAKREYDGQIFVSGLIVWPEYVGYTLLGLACPNPRDIPESLLAVNT